MSSVSVRLEGNTGELIERLQTLSDTDIAGTLNAIAEGIRTSTIERFNSQETPEGSRWRSSIRADKTGGKTLTESAALKTSIAAQADSSGAVVGTNLIYAATHQYGAERTIRAKNSRYLRFKIGDRWVTTPVVRVSIPARPFLGISREDDDEIRNILNDIFDE